MGRIYLVAFILLGGIIVYLNQQGGERGISALAKQMKSARFGIDKRNYQVAAEILDNLGVRSIRLMTENPQKVKQLKRLLMTTKSYSKLI